MNIKLIKPNLDYEKQVMAFREALLANNEAFDGFCWIRRYN